MSGNGVFFGTVILEEICRLVNQWAGIQLGPKQYPMVQSRVFKRILDLKLTSDADYLRYLKKNEEAEKNILVSLVTTHYSYFFREFEHFEFLRTTGLQSLVDAARKRGERRLRIWSAACSRGQEVLSLSMFLGYHLKKVAPDFTFEILGSDIDEQSIQFARNGVYTWDELKEAPLLYMSGNWLRGTGDISDFVKPKASIRTNCTYDIVNLLDAGSKLGTRKFDLIFCRNALIYFSQTQVRKITLGLLKHLDPEGFLVVGHSEGLNGYGFPLFPMAPSVYAQNPEKLKGAVTKDGVAGKDPLIRVFCVDDAPTILALLRKVLTAEKGFQIVGTASDGLEAAKKLQTIEADAVTLDIHMPKQDGLEYLRKNLTPDHPPVLMMSALSYDDEKYAKKALGLGARDYVEKPALPTLTESGEEIRSKLRSILANPLQAQSKAGAAPGGKIPFTSGKKIRILIVDDSSAIREVLTRMFSTDPNLEVVGVARRASEVEAKIQDLKPSVVTLDIHMPDMDGVTLLETIIPRYKIPTVMITSVSLEEGDQVLRALELGAVDYVQKPSLGELATLGPAICEKIIAAASAKVQIRSAAAVSRGLGLKGAPLSNLSINPGSLIAIGASTGGTEALRTLLMQMPAGIPPIVIVQHIPPVFSTAFANRLNQSCAFRVKEAVDHETLVPGTAWLAPGGKQMSVVKTGGVFRLKISDDPPVNRHKPSVDYLFESVAEALGSSAIGVLLTGMGGDGARGLLSMRRKGSWTVAQDEASSVVFGMPKEAIRLGAAAEVLGLTSIAEAVLRKCSKSRKAA